MRGSRRDDRRRHRTDRQHNAAEASDDAPARRLRPARRETRAAGPAGKRGAPWKRRRTVPDPKTRIVTIRFTPEQYEQLSEKANRAANDIGPMIRTIVLGSPGPRAVRRPPVEKVELARLLGAIGKVESAHNKIGSNVNQIAKALNEGRDAPTRDDLAAMRADHAVMRADTTAMRAAVMAALGRSVEP